MASVGSAELAKDCEEGGVPPSSRLKFKRGVLNVEGDRGSLMTSDRVFWSDATRRPTVGSEQGEESPTIRVPLARRTPA